MTRFVSWLRGLLWRKPDPRWEMVVGSTPHGWRCEARVKKMCDRSLLVDWVRCKNDNEVDVAPVLCWNPDTQQVTWIETEGPTTWSVICPQCEGLDAEAFVRKHN